MAIRRVSDLPDLTSIYGDDFGTVSEAIKNFGKCLLEVSYNHTGSLYQSFSTRASDIFNALCAELSIDIDIDNLVTISGDQTILGKKTFANSDGITISSFDSTTYNGNIKGITQLSDDVKAANQYLIPSPKAVHDYLSATYLPLTAFTDPQEIIDTLDSLINSKNEYCFVDPTVDSSADQDGTWQNPFKTLPQAIEKINKRRFVNSSVANIYVLNDYCISTTDFTADDLSIYQSECKPKVIDIYHPDMIQNKFLTVTGWEITDSERNAPSSVGELCIGKQKLRTLSANMMSCDQNDYWFQCRCNTRFNSCRFNGGISFTNTDTGKLSTLANTSYLIAGTDNMGYIGLYDCRFQNCIQAVHANIININNANVFMSCDIAINSVNPGVGRSSLAGSVCCVDCNYFARSQINSPIRFSSTEPISYLLLAIRSAAFTTNQNGSIFINLRKDDFNDNTHCIWLSHYDVANNANSKYELITQLSSSSIDSKVLRYLLDRDKAGSTSQGYDDNGYIYLNASASDLSGYLSKNNNNISADDLNSQFKSLLLFDESGFFNYSNYWSCISSQNNNTKNI